MSESYNPPTEQLAPAEPIIICNRCLTPFNAKREMPREWFNSCRCPSCGEKHTENEIICERDYIDEEYGGYKPLSNPSVLYLIQADNGLVKVGIASHFKNRFSSMKSDSASELTVLKTFEVPDAREVEREIHDQLIDENSHGEWFDLSDRSISGFVESVSLIAGRYEE